MADATITPALDANPTFEVVDPYEVFDDVETVNEQIAAALDIVSDLLSGSMVTGCDAEDRDGLCRRAWLLIEMTRSYSADNNRRFISASRFFHRFADLQQIEKSLRVVA